MKAGFDHREIDGVCAHARKQDFEHSPAARAMFNPGHVGLRAPISWPSESGRRRKPHSEGDHQ